jgi:pimeloyl-ACP methyl ester carboxylesterase
MNALTLPGAQLVYDVVGDGPAVVLVHGFGLDMRMWDLQIEDLAQSFRVVRYDCRGFGRTGPFDPSVPYTHSADLVALLDHLAISEAALVGLSFGGRVAMQTALLAPERTRALVLLDAVLEGVPWDPESMDALEEVKRGVKDAGVNGGREAWMRHPLVAPARENLDLAHQLTRMIGDYPGQHWLGLDPHRSDEASPIDALSTLMMPTMVVVGDRDVPCFIAMADTLAVGIPGAVYHRVPNAGHMVNMEAPAIVNRLLVEFLRGLPHGTGEGLRD